VVCESELDNWRNWLVYFGPLLAEPAKSSCHHLVKVVEDRGKKCQNWVHKMLLFFNFKLIRVGDFPERQLEISASNLVCRRLKEPLTANILAFFQTITAKSE